MLSKIPLYVFLDLFTFKNGILTDYIDTKKEEKKLFSTLSYFSLDKAV